jgi:flavodoxin
MRAIVIYDSKHGNTEQVAQAITSGVAETGVVVECRKISISSEEDLRGVDLWILGSMTHWGGAPFVLRTLLKNGLKEEGARSKRGAVFDTRYANMAKGASENLAATFTKAGVEVLGAEHFVVAGMKGPLLEGELERARAYGIRLGRALSG